MIRSRSSVYYEHMFIFSRWCHVPEVQMGDEATVEDWLRHRLGHYRVKRVGTRHAGHQAPSDQVSITNER